MKKWSRWLALALASALALSGCGNSATEEKPTTESEKEPTTAENQTQPEKEESKDASGKHEIKDLVTSQLVVNEMETFNMLYSQSQKEFDVLCNNWDGLLEVDPHGVPIAGIAKDWGTEDGGLTWTYNQNWSIARLEKDGYLPLELEDLSWENGKLAIEADPGIYRILTGNRLPNGNVFGKSLTFSVEKGEEKTVELSSREAKLNDMLEDIAILPFNLLEKDGTKVPAADVTRGGRKILFWLEVSKEPTEHILNELMEKKEAFEKYKENLLFIIKKEEDLNDPTLSRCRAALPGIPVLYDTFTENINTLGRRMYVDPEKLPLILVTSGELNGIYATSGYNVGTADMLLRILEM